MPSISLGSIFDSGGKTVVTGGSSQLDVEALVTSLVDLKRLPAVQLEKTVETNTGKIDALNELSGILETFRSAADFLRNPPGVGNAAANIFSYRTAQITSNSSVSGDTYISASVAPGTDAGSYTFTVDQLATKQVRVTNTFAAADLNAQAVGGGGPFNVGTLRLGPGLEEITLEDGDTLQEVITKINAVKADSGVEASTVKVSDGNYRIVFKSTTTGTSQNFDFTANNAGILNGGFFSEDDAVDALVTIDNTQVSRESNVISDLIDGVTLTLKQETPPGTEVSVEVKEDTTLVKDAILNFVDAYNAFRVFAAKQAATTETGEVAEGAVLGNNTVMRTLINSVGNEISAIVAGIASGPNSLSELGIKLTDFAGDDETPFTRNILQVDEGILDSALSANFDNVRQIFEFSYTADDPNLVVFSHTNALNTSSIQFNIDQTNGIYEATFDNGSGSQTISLTATALPGGGISLAAPDGSDLDGLVVLYTDTGDAVVNMSLSQGVADRLYNIINDSLDEDNGVVATEVQSLTDRNTRLEEDITRIDEQIERYRESLLERFSALEAAISSVNSILQLLDAQAAARENS